MGILAIISVILPVLTSVLTTYKVIPTNITSLVSSLVALLPGLVGVFQSKGSMATVPDSIIALLAAISTQIQTLKADTTLDPTLLNDIAALDDVITKTLAADAQGQKTVDPTTLTDIPSV